METSPWSAFAVHAAVAVVICTPVRADRNSTLRTPETLSRVFRRQYASYPPQFPDEPVPSCAGHPRRLGCAGVEHPPIVKVHGNFLRIPALDKPPTAHAVDVHIVVRRVPLRVVIHDLAHGHCSLDATDNDLRSSRFRRFSRFGLGGKAGRTAIRLCLESVM
jgi:hypothetical protein